MMDQVTATSHMQDRRIGDMDKRNPFPGMNPWMQTRWHDVHVRLITYIADELGETLPPALRMFMPFWCRAVLANAVQRVK